MQWIRLFLSCLLFESAAGSLAYATVQCSRKLSKEKDYFFVLAAQKAALLLYLIPVTFAYEYLSRIRFRPGKGYYVIVGEFVVGMVPGMYPVFAMLGILWMGGVLIFLYRYICKKIILHRLLTENREINRRACLDIFSEYQKRFPKAGLFLYENPAICAPLSVQRGRKHLILLPTRLYTEKELRIILEHETNHIAAKDLRWRLLGQAVLLMHWFNPVVYRQFRDLIHYQEIVCDLRSSLENPWFTKKEYAQLLALQAAPDLYLPGSSAFAEKKKNMIRRIEIMASENTLKKMKKRTMAAGCACLLGISLIPSMAFASTAAELQEAWLKAEETETIEEPQRWDDESIEEHGTDDDGVTEIYSSLPNPNARGSGNFEETIPGNTRKVFDAVSLSTGGSISISADCGDPDITYRIGIKNMDTGALTSISGKGVLMHTFTIKKQGNYAAYVENSSLSSACINGLISY